MDWRHTYRLYIYNILKFIEQIAKTDIKTNIKSNFRPFPISLIFYISFIWEQPLGLPWTEDMLQEKAVEK